MVEKIALFITSCVEQPPLIPNKPTLYSNKVLQRQVANVGFPCLLNVWVIHFKFASL